jgi:predicted regulator of Ras-like GTPase activity (Roadblock/LC7/MglB family)
MDFTRILQELVERVPGALGAIFADWEGEAVGQFAVALPDLEIKIVGAQWGVVWNEMQRALERARIGRAGELVVDARRGAVIVRQVTAEYFVVLSLRDGSQLAKALIEVGRVVQTLRAEM